MSMKTLLERMAVFDVLVIKRRRKGDHLLTDHVRPAVPTVLYEDPSRDTPTLRRD